MIAKSHYVRVGQQSFDVFPSQPETVKALWAALPPDLRLALAKTCPKVAGKWETNESGLNRRCNGQVVAHQDEYGWTVHGPNGTVGGPTSHIPVLDALAAADAALLAQGYVLDGDTP